MERAIYDATVVVLHTMRCHTKVPAVQRSACAALAELADYEGLMLGIHGQAQRDGHQGGQVSQPSIAVAGATVSVVAAMRAHPRSEPVQASACAALCYMCFSEPAVEALVSAMENHRDSVVLQGHACRALVNMMHYQPCSFHDFGDTVGAQVEAVWKSGAVKAMVVAMRTHASSEVLQLHACAALRVHAAVLGAHIPARCPKPVHLATALVAAMVAYPSSVPIQTDACGILEAWLDADYDDLRQMIEYGAWAVIAEADTVAAVTAAMRAHPRSKELQERACQVLFLLVSCQVGYSRARRGEGSIRIIGNCRGGDNSDDDWGETPYSIEKSWTPLACMQRAGAMQQVERARSRWGTQLGRALVDLMESVATEG